MSFNPCCSNWFYCQAANILNPIFSMLRSYNSDCRILIPRMVQYGHLPSMH